MPQGLGLSFLTRRGTFPCGGQFSYFFILYRRIFMNTQNIDWRHTDFLDVIEQEMNITICLYDDTGEFYLGLPGENYLPGEWPVAGDRWCNHCRVNRINGARTNRDKQDAANAVITRFFAQYRVIRYLAYCDFPSRDPVKSLVNEIMYRTYEDFHPSYDECLANLKHWLLRLIHILDNKSDKDLLALSERECTAYPWEQVEMRARQAYLTVCLDIYRAEREAEEI
jgi:hypothetical protein